MFHPTRLELQCISDLSSSAARRNFLSAPLTGIHSVYTCYLSVSIMACTQSMHSSWKTLTGPHPTELAMQSLVETMHPFCDIVTRQEVKDMISRCILIAGPILRSTNFRLV